MFLVFVSHEPCRKTKGLYNYSCLPLLNKSKKNVLKNLGGHSSKMEHPQYMLMAWKLAHLPECLNNFNLRVSGDIRKWKHTFHLLLEKLSELKGNVEVRLDNSRAKELSGWMCQFADLINLTRKKNVLMHR